MWRWNAEGKKGGNINDSAQGRILEIDQIEKESPSNVNMSIYIAEVEVGETKEQKVIATSSYLTMVQLVQVESA